MAKFNLPSKQPKEQEEIYRYEKKFHIKDTGLKEIEHFIKINPLMFSERFYIRKVNSIYLDTMNLDNYHEHIAGINQRVKIRIRWYGDTFGIIKKPVLELKIRNNELGIKKSYPLKTFNFNEKFSKEKLKESFVNSDIPEFLKEELKMCVPVLLISYKRKYFVSIDGKHRITLDFNQVFYNLSSNNNRFNEKIKDEESYILEIKSGLKDYSEAIEIGQYLPFRLTANSKYCTGIDLFKD